MEDVPFFRAAAASRATATSALAAALAGSNNSNSASALSGASSSHHHHHHGSSKRDLAPPLKERQLAYVQASMIIMSRQYPALHHQQQQQSAAATQMSIRQPYLTVEAENAMLESINRIVKPPKKPIQTKIIMRRAPTQEEFFRGSLSRNPISVDSLARSTGSSSGGENTATATTPSDSYEPTVGDLRQHIANDLQMADSAELIEIIVANKILDMSLKLRVVHQVLWRKHLMENASSSSAPGGPSLFSVGSGLSMILSTTGGGPACPINADTPLSQLPPMIAMYRLAGVDGEATEDTLGVDELIDPEAPASADSCTPEELQRLLEKDFGITRIVTEGRGILVLLRSIQHAVADSLRRIRRDDVVGMVGATGICRSTNPSRAQFQTSPPCQGLTLLRHCSRLACNRKMLLQARAPTVLLTLLLDVLKSLEDDTTATTKSNPTADILQELIEVLASDISTGASSASNSSAEAEIESSGYESDAAFDASSMPMLLESIETIALSAPLRKIIGKLLPFLTYGQADLSRTLAQHFDRHIVVEALEEEKDDGDAEMQAVDSAKSSTILMHTFVQTAMSLPANAVCNSLRTELINCGFIDRLALFIIKDMPKQPPSWSHALWSNVQQYRAEEASVPTKGKASSSMSTALSARSLEAAWRQYYARSGIQTAFRILTGLCKSHKTTQARVAMFAGFLLSCHWIEATSDSSSLGVNTNGLGLLAETLLDEMMEDNKDVNKLVEDVRKKTRLRKKELAQERRNKALGKMSAFGPLAGSAVAIALNESESSVTASSSASASVRGAAASILARSVLGFFGGANAAVANAPSAPAAALPSSSSRGVRSSGSKAKKAAEKPSWMTEMESMEDETGLTCAICQEGRTLQPEELLGLYAFVKKILIPLDQCGARSSIDGSVLLKALPSTLPGSLQGTRIANTWLPIGKAAGEELTPSSSMCTSSGGRRMSLFTTTVSAGNGIHLSCHRRARAVDRTHPKAPKSEWEGAKLRNGRVDCNIILPLVSSRSSKVSLIAVDAALSEHQSAVSNLLGATPKSMLWTNLYDTRFLLLRMAYGEALDTDCGGGSLESNCNLLFYQMVIAATFDRDAQMEQPDQSQHARGLSAGFIAACALVTNDDCKGGNVTLTRGIADAAPMACLTSILFHNGNNDGGEGEGVRNGDDHSRGTSSDDNEGRDCPHPNRRWVVARDYFLRGLVICAGRRHALRLVSSGCWTSRNVSSRQKSNSYATWGDASGTNTANASTTPAATTRSGGASAGGGSNTSSSSDKLTIKDFQHALRPMITFYAMMEQLSAEFALNMEDVAIRQGAERLARTIEDCLRCKNIHQLLATAKVTMAPEALLELLQKGMVVA
jgi:E3 ubiquitin-protein ligase UBR4